MSDSRAQYDQLQDEMRLVEKAMPPQQAGKSLRDYIDAHAQNDALAGTADGANPWLQVAPNPGGCCVIS